MNRVHSRRVHEVSRTGQRRSTSRVAPATARSTLETARVEFTQRVKMRPSRKYATRRSTCPSSLASPRRKRALPLPGRRRSTHKKALSGTPQFRYNLSSKFGKQPHLRRQSPDRAALGSPPMSDFRQPNGPQRGTLRRCGRSLISHAARKPDEPAGASVGPCSLGTGRGRARGDLGAGLVGRRGTARAGRRLPPVGRPSGGLRRPRMPNGAPFSTRAVCLGWHWYPYRYSRTCDDGDGAPVKEFPPLLKRLGAAACTATGFESVAYDAAIVNLYEAGAKLGLHQDKIESAEVVAAGSPVVTISLGDRCIFRFGNTDRPSRPCTDVELASGDLFVFGGPSRLAFHGVPKTYAGSGSSRTRDRRPHQRHIAPGRCVVGERRLSPTRRGTAPGPPAPAARPCPH